MAVLKDTSLCAIVRDEKMNPAGGVERFLRCHLPYVEEAVVVDTGSVDGTREILDQMTKEFSHLKVYDTKFEGFAQARNVSLEKVKTKWALVLDADELIEPASFERVSDGLKRVNSSKLEGLKFFMQRITHSGPVMPDSSLHNPRLFNAQLGFRYMNKGGRAGEWLYEKLMSQKVQSCGNLVYPTGESYILHFLSGDNEGHDKYLNLYSVLIKGELFKGNLAEVKGFAKWRKLNPHRAKYAG